ncbi:hypothetical protein [Thermogymnomonas acidicola]|uniref:molybdopterin-binding protein n=1 Tax=Thermogymnomonas acidicola TaxID=399579 RepID=UPI000946855D|nr:molybdopterin-binding protein [Thermogymnomonas acidicola]
MQAAVLTIGNEILKGKTVNTNAAHIGRVLTFSGHTVVLGLTVRDVREEIVWGGFRTASQFADIVVSTGGLGPTFDDMTSSSFAEALGLPLVENLRPWR